MRSLAIRLVCGRWQPQTNRYAAANQRHQRHLAALAAN